MEDYILIQENEKQDNKVGNPFNGKQPARASLAGPVWTQWYDSNTAPGFQGTPVIKY